MEAAGTKLRARDYGIPFSGTPGRWNAITDVPGVKVGYKTLWHGEGKLEVGKGPVRTGVTAVLPRGHDNPTPCFGAWATLNGAGEMTGTVWLDERGLCEGPVLITNTHQVGVVRDAAIQWMRMNGGNAGFQIPIVAETYDGLFNDMDGGHITSEHVFEALNDACSGLIAEGSVGGGTGMICYEYKAGTGTASRRFTADDQTYHLGVLVQTNYGERRSLRIGGIPIGPRLSDDRPRFMDEALVPADAHEKYARWVKGTEDAADGRGIGDGSIIVIIVTDAPLLPHQLKRLAKRPALALGRLGGLGASLSGDIFLALSTANADIREDGGTHPIEHFPNLSLTPVFEAAIDATEEAIVNALVAGEAGEGIDRFYVPALPIDRVQAMLDEHGLLKAR